jgi:hypothetical protein
MHDTRQVAHELVTLLRGPAPPDVGLDHRHGVIVLSGLVREIAETCRSASGDAGILIIRQHEDHHVPLSCAAQRAHDAPS